MGLPVSDFTDLTDRWAEQAKDDASTLDIEGDGEEELLIAMQTALGDLSRAVANTPPDRPTGSETEVDEKVAELGGLLLRFNATFHDRDISALIDDPHEQSGTQTTSTGVEDLETVNEITRDEQPGPSDDEIRRRVEELVEQGVSSVSRISSIILKEYTGVDRRDVNKIASEVRDEVGDMETLGDPDKLVGEQSEDNL